jgi:hypothetical protein
MAVDDLFLVANRSTGRPLLRRGSIIFGFDSTTPTSTSTPIALRFIIIVDGISVIERKLDFVTVVVGNDHIPGNGRANVVLSGILCFRGGFRWTSPPSASATAPPRSATRTPPFLSVADSRFGFIPLVFGLDDID